MKTIPCISALEAIGLGEMRISARGVPHLIARNETKTYSVTFFEKTQTYRIFWPYPSASQKRKDLKLPTQVRAFLEIMGAK